MALTMLVRILCVCAHICVVTLQRVKTEPAAVVKAYKFSRIQAISCAAFPLLRSGFNFDLRRPRRFFSDIPVAQLSVCMFPRLRQSCVRTTNRRNTTHSCFLRYVQYGDDNYDEYVRKT